MKLIANISFFFYLSKTIFDKTQYLNNKTMPEQLTTEELLSKAETDGFIQFSGDGKNQKVIYVNSKNRAER